RRLVIAFEEDLSLLPAHLLLQHLAIGAHHVIEPADVGIQVHSFRFGPVQEDLAHALLHVSTVPFPVFLCAAESHDVMKVWMVRSNLRKVILVVDICRITTAIDQVDLAVFMSWGFAKEPLYEGAHWSDTGAGGNEQGVAQGIAQYKIPMRPME